ncbi:MAG: hypothetical protein U0572_09485 [Phycisphaerales bacterium]
MQSSSRRTVLLSVAIIVAALVFSLAVRPTVSLRGIAGPTLRLAESPAVAIVWVAACFSICVGVACVVGRLINAVVGMFVLGCGVALLAMRSGTIKDLAFSSAGLGGVAAETFAWALVVGMAAIIVFQVSGPLPDAAPIDEPRVDGVLGTKGLMSQLAAALVVVGVWLIDVTPTKGQSLGAVVVGCVLAGLAARIVAPRTPPILIYATPILVGAVAHVVASLTLPKGTSLDRAFIEGSLSRLAFPMPIDYAAGALVGVSIGIGWSRSFIKTEAQPARA